LSGAAYAFDNGNYNTPDSWSMHVAPGKITESYNGIGVGEDNLYLTLTSRYRLKTNDYADDQDFYQYVRLRNDGTKLGEGTVKVSVFARFADDLDGDSGRDWGSDSYYVQRDILDTELDYNNWAPRVYQGNVILDGVLKNTKLTLGRMYLSHMDNYQLDGGDLTVQAGDHVTMYAFGGKPVSYYYDLDDDRVYGGGGVLEFQNTKVRAEYTRLDIEDIEDDYSKFRIDQTLPKGVVSLMYTLLDGMDTVNADFTYELPSGTIVSLGYEGLLDDVDDHDNTYVVNPLTYTLLPESKYNKYEISLYQSFLEHFAAGISYEQKDVDGDENFDNRNYKRYQGKFDIIGLPSDNTYISLIAEVWDIEGTDSSDDNSRIQYGARVSQKLSEAVDVWLGTSFNRYEYDYLNDTRKDSVRSYYVGGQYQPTEVFCILVDLSMEDTEFYDDMDDDLQKSYTAEIWANLSF